MTAIDAANNMIFQAGHTGAVLILNLEVSAATLPIVFVLAKRKTLAESRRNAGKRWQRMGGKVRWRHFGCRGGRESLRSRALCEGCASVRPSLLVENSSDSGRPSWDWEGPSRRPAQTGASGWCGRPRGRATGYSITSLVARRVSAGTVGGIGTGAGPRGSVTAPGQLDLALPLCNCCANCSSPGFRVIIKLP